MKSKSSLIACHAALIAGILLFAFLPASAHNNLIIRLVAVMTFINCVNKPIAVYQLTGKIYQ